MLRLIPFNCPVAVKSPRRACQILQRADHRRGAVEGKDSWGTPRSTTNLGVHRRIGSNDSYSLCHVVGCSEDHREVVVVSADSAGDLDFGGCPLILFADQMQGIGLSGSY